MIHTPGQSVLAPPRLNRAKKPGRRVYALSRHGGSLPIESESFPD